MMQEEKRDKFLNKFFENVGHLSKGEKVALARNHSLFENANYNVIITLMKCIPDEEGACVSNKDYQNLLFVASVFCELGYKEKTCPSDAIATAIKKMQNGDTKMSDILAQDTSTGRVYPLMRKYLSMYKNPINVYTLYKDLSVWDVYPYKIRYIWASAWARISKK